MYAESQAEDTGRSRDRSGGASTDRGEGPVFITDRGRPAHVLLTIEDYERLAGLQPSLVERLGLPEGVEDIELEIPTSTDLARAADFS